MTNTKFRKRALLSSVAMLLVALVALGSATFAWFVDSPNASASGLAIKATASKGLEVKAATDSRGFSNATILNYDSQTQASGSGAFNIQPASYVGGNSFLGVKALAGNAADANPEETVSAVTPFNNTTGFTAADSGVYKEEIALKVTGGEAADVYLSGITVTGAATGKDVISALRILLTDASGTVLAYTNASTATTGSDKVFVTDDGNKLYKNTTAGNASTDDDATLALALAKTKVAEAVDTSGNTKLNLYVFLNGFDANCKSNVVDGSQLLSSITLNFTITA